MGRAKDLQADEKTDHPSSRAFHGSPAFGHVVTIAFRSIAAK
ncbi:hypothetical protein RISK_005036 [Rhodopirellula islandica]|uniref:Uncharacterized protein n=1 Tax=Rhodopirellula islandica TaxID=595434 RepID=A0A0J1B7D6_RHOIS|nr:hypothetical protein RISK_005036 [Rhodopirellula islandica]